MGNFDGLAGTGTQTISAAAANKRVGHGYFVGFLLPEQFIAAGQSRPADPVLTLIRMAFIIVHQSNFTGHVILSFHFS